MSVGNFGSQSTVIGRANPTLRLNESLSPRLTLNFNRSNGPATTGMVKIPSYSPVIPLITPLVIDKPSIVRPLTPTIKLSLNNRPVSSRVKPSELSSDSETFPTSWQSSLDPSRILGKRGPMNISLTPVSSDSSIDESVLTLKSIDDLSTVDQDLKKLGFTVIGKIVTEEKDEKIIRFVRIETKDECKVIMENKNEEANFKLDWDAKPRVSTEPSTPIDFDSPRISTKSRQILQREIQKNNIMYFPLVTFSEILHSPDKMSDYIAKSYTKLNRTSTQISLSDMVSHIKIMDHQRNKLVNILKSQDNKFFQNSQEVQTLLVARET